MKSSEYASSSATNQKEIKQELEDYNYKNDEANFD
jgi:hypothetical protein